MQHVWVYQSYLCSVASTIFPSYIISIDTHIGIETVNPTHMFVVLINAVGPIDFYVILLARVTTFHLCVRQICMDIKKNCHRSVVFPCHTRYTTSVIVHLHSSAFFAFDVFFVEFPRRFALTVLVALTPCSFRIDIRDKEVNQLSKYTSLSFQLSISKMQSITDRAVRFLDTFPPPFLAPHYGSIK